MNKSIHKTPSWQVTLAVVFVAQLVTSLAFSVIMPFIPLYVRELESSLQMNLEMAAGLSVSAAGLTMMLSAPLWGAVADRYGRKLMLLRATFSAMILLGLMGLAQTVEQLIVLRLLQGFMTGTAAASSALVAAVIPREKSGFGMGLLQVGLWGGVAIGPLLGGVLADAYGFHMPFAVTAVLIFASGILIIFGVHEEFKPVQRTKNSPSLWQQWRTVVQTDGVRTLYAIRFLAGMGRNMVLPIAPLFVVSLVTHANAQNSYAGLVASVSSFTATISGVVLGRMGDKVGHRRVLLVSAILASFSYVPQFAVVDVWQLLGLQAITGFAFGGILSSVSALLSGITEHGSEGVVYGLDNSIVAGAFALAPIIGSTIASLFGIRMAFLLTTFFFVGVGLLAYYMIPRQKQVFLSPAIGD